MRKNVLTASLAVVVMAGIVSAAPEFKFSGDVDFRLRGQWDLQLDTAGNYYEEKTKQLFTSVYAWNLKSAVKVNDNVSLKFRLSNPAGSALETISKNEGTAGAGNFLAIPQAEIQYTAGFFGLSAGILEVNNSTVLNLVRASEEKLYTGNIDLSNNWSTRYNNSQTGLKFSFATGEMVDINVVTAIAEYKAPTDSSKGFTDLRLIADAPITFGEDDKFVVTPSAAVRSGLVGDFSKREMNTNGGVDFSGKLTDNVSLKAGAAYGQFWNATAKSGEWVSPAALLLTVTPSVKFGINTVSLGYSFGQAKDRELTGDAAYSKRTNHADLRWGVELAKNISISPRYRMWLSSDTKDGSDSKITHRPELMFNARF